MKFLNIFKTFYQFLEKNLPHSYSTLLNMIELVSNLFSFKNDIEMTNLVTENFILLCKIIKQDDIGHYVLKPILKFTTEDFQENERVISRCLGANLLGELAVILGQDYCNNFVISQLLYLADDNKSEVRISVARNLIKISEQVSFNIFEKKVLYIYKMYNKLI